jgi:hypothetical protein
VSGGQDHLVIDADVVDGGAWDRGVQRQDEEGAGGEVLPRGPSPRWAVSTRRRCMVPSCSIWLFCVPGGRVSCVPVLQDSQFLGGCGEYLRRPRTDTEGAFDVGSASPGRWIPDSMVRQSACQRALTPCRRGCTLAETFDRGRGCRSRGWGGRVAGLVRADSVQAMGGLAGSPFCV